MNDEPEDQQQGYDFASEEVLSALKWAREGGGSLAYLGSATSHFQAEPFMYGPDRRLPSATDWEYELAKNVEGKPSGIAVKQSVPELPRFMVKRDLYLKRSRELGESMFRFSLNFGRLCPEPEAFNEELMKRYVETLALIRANGQEPMLTLHHFTMPLFLTGIAKDGRISSGGWEHPKALEAFRFYMEKVAVFLADRDKIASALDGLDISVDLRKKLVEEGLVRYFVTLNEPSVILLNGYVTGEFPPYKKADLAALPSLLDKMVKAHDIAVGAFKLLDKTAAPEWRPLMGAGYSWQYFDGPLGPAVREIMDEYFTRRFERGGSHSDFLDIHYYFRMTIPFGRLKGREYAGQPDFGDIYPAGLIKLAERVHKLYPDKFIFFSEVGFAGEHDPRRPFWICETLRYAFKAMKEGLPIRGLLLWSLVDNLEWNLGMGPRFGLFSEKDLERPLLPQEGLLRSWQVWQAAAKAISDPSIASLLELQRLYERARIQHAEFAG